MSRKKWSVVFGTALAMGAMALPGKAMAVPVTFTELPGTTGGTPAGTGVFRANLGTLGMGTIASITITDSNSGVGGSPGQFSGFDLDAIVISTTLINNANQANNLVPAATFNFSTATLTPGTQRTPTSPALFGTTGGKLNNAVATLASFDGNNSTTNPFGFISLGDGGSISLNLNTALNISSPLYLYIGEVGNNGEVAASSVTVNALPIGVPEPTTMALLGSGLLAGGLVRRRARTG